MQLQKASGQASRGLGSSKEGKEKGEGKKERAKNMPGMKVVEKKKKESEHF